MNLEITISNEHTQIKKDKYDRFSVKRGPRCKFLCNMSIGVDYESGRREGKKRVHMASK